MSFQRTKRRKTYRQVFENQKLTVNSGVKGLVDSGLAPNLGDPNPFSVRARSSSHHRPLWYQVHRAAPPGVMEEVAPAVADRDVLAAVKAFPECPKGKDPPEGGGGWGGLPLHRGAASRS